MVRLEPATRFSWRSPNIPAMFVGCGLCAVGALRSPVLFLVAHVCNPSHIAHRLTVAWKRAPPCTALALLEALCQSAGRSPNRSYRLAEWSNLFPFRSPGFCQDQEHVFSHQCHPVGGPQVSLNGSLHIYLGWGWSALDR